MCIFCRIVKGEASGEIVYQDDEVTAFRDINPKAPTHILVVPNKHIRSLAYAEAEDTFLLVGCCKWPRIWLTRRALGAVVIG